jgi:dTDP-4-amino-4,6-dideoxygalactose transaminase
VRTEDRNGLQAALQAEGVQTAIHYSIPAHLQPAYADLGYGKGSLPRSEAAAEQVLSLPIYPELSDRAIAKVALAVRKAAPKAQAVI